MQVSKLVFLCSSFNYPPRNGAALREAGILTLAKDLAPVEIINVLPPRAVMPNFPRLPWKLISVARESAPLWKKFLFPFRPYVVNGFSHHVLQTLKECYEPGALLWISRLALAQYIRPAQELGYRVILDEHNVESDYFYHSVLSSRKWLELPLALQLRYWEKRFCTSADRVVVTSQRDRTLLENLVKKSHIEVLPNCIPAQTISARREGSLNRLLFVGTLDYEPNMKGLAWFLEEVVPLLRTENFSINVVGARPSEKFMDYLKSKGAQVYANVPDLGLYYDEAKVCIAPILSGGGTRLKILECLGRAKALVSTRKGAEGLELQSESHLLLADSAEDFAKAVDRFLQSDELRCTLSENGKKFVAEHFTWPAQSTVFEKICRF